MPGSFVCSSWRLAADCRSAQSQCHPSLRVAGAAVHAQCVTRSVGVQQAVRALSHGRDTLNHQGEETWMPGPARVSFASLAPRQDRLAGWLDCLFSPLTSTLRLSTSHGSGANLTVQVPGSETVGQAHHPWCRIHHSSLPPVAGWDPLTLLSLVQGACELGSVCSFCSLLVPRTDGFPLVRLVL